MAIIIRQKGMGTKRIATRRVIEVGTKWKFQKQFAVWIAQCLARIAPVFDCQPGILV